MNKLLPIIVFWGLWILIISYLMASRDNTPDYNYPDDGLIEQVCPNGYPC